MSGIDSVSDDMDNIFDYTNENDKMNAAQNLETKSALKIISDLNKQITKLYQSCNHNIEQMYCMGRCTAKRNTQWGVIIRKDKEGNTSGSMELIAPSEDGKDSLKFDLHVDNDGNVSGEASYRYNTGPEQKK